MSKYYSFLLLLIFLSTGCKSSVMDAPSINGNQNVVWLFGVSEKSHVKGSIENSYNTVIATPMDSIVTPGMHQISWSTKNASAGIYFLILEYKEINSGNYYKYIMQTLVIK